MECGALLDVPEGMRDAALGMTASATTRDAFPEFVKCELDPHRYGEHAAPLWDIDPAENDGAIWIAWGANGSDITVQIRSYCPSKSPSKEDACWLHDTHRGGHTWERYE